MAQVANALGVGVDERVETIENEIVNGPYLPRSEWRTVADVLATGGKTDGSQGDCLRDAANKTGSDQVETYLGFFVTGTGGARKSLMTKPLVKGHPDLAERLHLEQARVLQVSEKFRAVIQRDRTRALLTIAKAVSDNYRREKRERGLLDYDDLIDKTGALLTRVEIGRASCRERVYGRV